MSRRRSRVIVRGVVTRCRCRLRRGLYIGCVLVDLLVELGDGRICELRDERSVFLEVWGYWDLLGPVRARLVQSSWGIRSLARILDLTVSKMDGQLLLDALQLTISFAPIRSFFPATGSLRSFRLYIFGILDGLLVPLASGIGSLSPGSVRCFRFGLVVRRRLGDRMSLLRHGRRGRRCGARTLGILSVSEKRKQIVR